MSFTIYILVEPNCIYKILSCGIPCGKILATPLVAAMRKRCAGPQAMHACVRVPAAPPRATHTARTARRISFVSRWSRRKWSMQIKQTSLYTRGGGNRRGTKFEWSRTRYVMRDLFLLLLSIWLSTSKSMCRDCFRVVEFSVGEVLKFQTFVPAVS
jgi:hypothetical protein